MLIYIYRCSFYRCAGSVVSAIAAPGASLELCDMTATVATRRGEPTVLLDAVSARFFPGQLTAVMGPSGAGKSTLISAASLRASERVPLVGSVRCNGRPVATQREVDAYCRSVGFVPQQLDLVLDFSLTAAENLFFQALLRWDQSMDRMLHGGATGGWLSRSEKIRMVVLELLHRFGLLPYRSVRAADLSGGSRRRLAIAIECLQPAPIMFLDEPTTGQDADTALEVMRLLSGLATQEEFARRKTVRHPH